MRGADVASCDPSEIVFDESVAGGRSVDEAERDEQQAGAKCERNRSTAGRKRHHPPLRLQYFHSHVVSAFRRTCHGPAKAGLKPYTTYKSKALDELKRQTR